MSKVQCLAMAPFTVQVARWQQQQLTARLPSECYKQTPVIIGSFVTQDHDGAAWVLLEQKKVHKMQPHGSWETATFEHSIWLLESDGNPPQQVHCTPIECRHDQFRDLESECGMLRMDADTIYVRDPKQHGHALDDHTTWTQYPRKRT